MRGTSWWQATRYRVAGLAALTLLLAFPATMFPRRYASIPISPMHY